MFSYRVNPALKDCNLGMYSSGTYFCYTELKISLNCEKKLSLEIQYSTAVAKLFDLSFRRDCGVATKSPCFLFRETKYTKIKLKDTIPFDNIKISIDQLFGIIYYTESKPEIHKIRLIGKE